jgi:hypothetical protein
LTVTDAFAPRCMRSGGSGLLLSLRRDARARGGEGGDAADYAGSCQRTL